MVHSATKEVSVLPAESEGGALFTLITPLMFIHPFFPSKNIDTSNSLFVGSHKSVESIL